MTKRNYGLDLLKILSMIYVIILHANGQGGLMSAAGFDDLYHYFIVGFIEVWTICAVDCFALVGGFVSYSEKKKDFTIKPIILLWMTTVFVSVVITSITQVINPSLVTKSVWLRSVLPFLSEQYWYFNAYVITILFVPLINRILNVMYEETFVFVLALIFIIFSCFATAGWLVGKDYFRLSRGYTYIWLSILYFIGGGIKKWTTNKELSLKKLWKIFWITITATLMMYVITNLLSAKLCDGKPQINELFYVYFSPFVLFISILYLLIFSKMKVKESYHKMISIITPGVFSAYIVNCHPVIWTLWVDKFIVLMNYSSLILLLTIVIVSILWVIVISLLDIIRQIIFKKINATLIASKIDKLFYELTTKMGKALKKSFFK